MLRNDTHTCTHKHIKICEKVGKDRWTKSLSDKNLIMKKLFGFGIRRSGTTCLISFYLRVIDEIQERDRWVDRTYPELK